MKGKNSTIVMGIDPGSVITGYGFVVDEGKGHRLLDYGCIRPPQKERISKRRHIIYEGLLHLIETYQPTAISVETQFVRHNVQTAMTLGMVRGIAILAATQKGVPIFEYAPSKAKKAVTGQGGATKQQVQAMVQRLLNLPEPPQPEDAADALSLALCHLNATQCPQLLGKEL